VSIISSIKGKKVLITGADGFIGSHLTELLVQCSCDIRALVQYNSFGNWGWLDSVGCRSDIEVVAGDIRDENCISTSMEHIDIVFHLAALIAIPYSYQAPDSYVQTNVTGTLNILKAALHCGVERVLHTSTSEVYGSAQYVPIDERHPLQPQSPYSATKIAADALAESFYRSFGLPVAIVRPFNTYGPRQSARAVIPTVITQLLSGEGKIKLGNLEPTRDFNYVEDTCRGFLAIADCNDAIGTAVNIGSNKEISIGGLISLIQDIMESNVVIDSEDERVRPEKSEVNRLRCDHSRLVKLTGFKPQISLREGLTRTISWLSQPENLNRYKTDIYHV